jgi:2-polyprenyl-3-methyl-5-hydroxy-6-metoxy-1,4-benzoquinol methylase
MQVDQILDRLKDEYDSDDAYFELLSSWHDSGRFGRRTRPILRQLHSFLQPSTIALDAGCAAGAMGIELAKAGVAHVDAVDFSSMALRFARMNAAKHGVADRVRFIESKLEQLNHTADNTYDVIVAADVIEHIVVPSAFIDEMWRVCKPNGVMLIETPNALFRQHPWYPAIERFCRHLGLPQSHNLFPTDPAHNWDRYHVSLLKWPELEQLLQEHRWAVVQACTFGWWMQPGAADTLMAWLGKLGNLLNTNLKYYGSSDVVIIARKPV